MNTSVKLYYSISEVAKYFNEEVSAIRYWDKEFKMLKPKKNARGVRYFTAEDIEILKNIHYLLRIKKLTVKGAKQELAQQGDKVQHKVEVLQKLEDIKTLLEKIKTKL